MFIHPFLFVVVHPSVDRTDRRGSRMFVSSVRSLVRKKNRLASSVSFFYLFYRFFLFSFRFCFCFPFRNSLSPKCRPGRFPTFFDVQRLPSPPSSFLFCLFLLLLLLLYFSILLTMSPLSLFLVSLCDGDHATKMGRMRRENRRGQPLPIVEAISVISLGLFAILSPASHWLRYYYVA